VLESIKQKFPWEWSAMGKHPVALDYFRLGVSAPLVNAFAGWIENGYQKVVGRNRDTSAFHSWRFWARGIRKGHIACGVARDSFDSAGRPYPLLIMGIGRLSNWEANWDLLNFLFEGIWNQIEYVASRRFADIKELESEISRIKLPVEDWPTLADQRLRAGGPDHVSQEPRYSHVLRDVQKAAETLLKGNEFHVSINNDHGGDALLLSGYWNCALKSRMDIIPNAAFMGGVPERSYLAIFTRSLNSSDFARLWSVSSEDHLAF
jgi:type VI secretion system ImpM family protein